ncbi:MAG: hypothetical protein TQ37_08265 [Candidatus Synechococcus spongiarum 15L]|uniref:Uncharacterized protein n=1 Tax=Candidatus Synechococcus spongiarum 15L TaxID=1608419 RepID=A0A0G8ASE5_9SYNE|nr:MAG: hypothetical protein TQ37_08265 [Candidatus Synechococcus spongiarum 15L]
MLLRLYPDKCDPVLKRCDIMPRDIPPHPRHALGITFKAVISRMGCFAKVADKHLGCRGSGQQGERTQQQRWRGNNQTGGASE